MHATLGNSTSWVLGCLSYTKTDCGNGMQRLYELGARRVIVTGTGMIGCVPAELALHSLDGSCAPDLTRAADLFNPQLERMLTELNGEVGHDDVFIAANTNRVSFDFMFNPQQYGMVSIKQNSSTHLVSIDR